MDSPTPRRYRHRRWRFTEALIIRWADVFFRTHRKWPAVRDGLIPDSNGAAWDLVDRAIRDGRYGLAPQAGGLPLLLAQHRGAPLRARARPKLQVHDILAWAKAYHKRTGFWPTKNSGRVPEAPGETWNAIDGSLRAGLRGMPGGQSLPLLLLERLHQPQRVERHVRFSLDAATIVRWAREHAARTGRWPSQRMRKAILAPEAEGRSWNLIDQALRSGLYGLPGGDSLGQLLARHRGIPAKNDQPPLDERQIVAWATAYRQAHGHLPGARSGMVLDEQSRPTGNTWRSIDSALIHGVRGLPGGDTLPKLLRRNFGTSKKRVAPPLTEAQIAQWMRKWKDTHGRWPRMMSGPVPRSDGETWASVLLALQRGARGLPKTPSIVAWRKQHGMQTK